MKIKDLKKNPWEKYWAGNWSFITACYWAFYYTHEMKEQMGQGLKKAVIVSKNGYSSSYLDPADRKVFGKHVGSKIGKNRASAIKFGEQLKKEADNLVKLGQTLMKQKSISTLDYQNYIDKFLEYSGPHISVRHTIDFLPPAPANELLPIFQEVRLYVEKVFSESERFMNTWAKQVGKKVGIDPKLILCLTPVEMNGYLESRKLPDKKILQKRYVNSSGLFDENGYKIFSSLSIKGIEKLLQGSVNKKELKGTVAYPGLVKGNARIIFEPNLKNIKKFQKGNILVTGMTRPEFLPLMNKAGAVITDAGGILSHAAITAREMKKPCVIGTQNATKIFKDGDLVEVDANKGIVRRI